MIKLLSVDNLSFSYGSQAVLTDITFSLLQGEWLSLLGPNGSGKTTCLKLLTRLLRPDSGEIRIHECRLDEMEAKKLARLIGFVPQDHHFTFPYTALEVVMMGRAPFWDGFGFDTKRDLGISQRVMQRTDTWPLRNRNIQTLSGGEKQRVILARALAQEPSILILDEPTSHLDIRHQREIGSLLKELNKQDGLTILSVMHDINLASLYSDRIAFMKEGHLKHAGPPHEILTHQIIRKIFDTDVYVGINDLNQHLYYLPLA